MQLACPCRSIMYLMKRSWVRPRVCNVRQCGHINASGALRCAICQSAISSEDLTQSNIAPAACRPREPGSVQDPCSGTLLAGRYEIVQLLGQGGMGTVYKAQRRGTGSLVAIKVIRADLANELPNPGPVQAGTHSRAPDHAQERHPHLRSRHPRRRQVHHHGVCGRPRSFPSSWTSAAALRTSRRASSARSARRSKRPTAKTSSTAI